MSNLMHAALRAARGCSSCRRQLHAMLVSARRCGSSATPQSRQRPSSKPKKHKEYEVLLKVLENRSNALSEQALKDHKVLVKKRMNPILPDHAETMTVSSVPCYSQADFSADVLARPLEETFDLAEGRQHYEPSLPGDLSRLDPEIAEQVLKEETGEEDEAPKKGRPRKKQSLQEVLDRASSQSSSKKKASDERVKELEKTAKEVYFNWSLRSYLGVCIGANMMMKAHACLQHYRARSKCSKKAPKVRDVRTYDVLLRGWAGKGNLIRVREIFDILAEEKLRPSLQSYAAYLECLGRSTKPDATHIEGLLRKMKQEGYSIDQLFKECTFIADQKETVLKCVRAVMPDYTPMPPNYPNGYDCRLLKDIDKIQAEAHTPCGHMASLSDLRAWLKEQLETEKRGHLRVKSVEQHPDSERILFLRKKVSECEEEWRHLLMERFTAYLQTMKNQLRNDNEISLYPYLVVLDPQQYVDVLMQEIRELALSSELFSPSLNVLHHRVGIKVMSRYLISQKMRNGILDKMSSLYSKYLEYFTDPEAFSRHTPREFWQMLKRDNFAGPTIDREEELWTTDVLIRLGKVLYGLLLNNVTIDVKILQPSNTSTQNSQKQLMPAFYHICRNVGKMNKMEIKQHPILSKLYKSACLEEIMADVDILPMLVPPLPWSSSQSGGFLLFHTPFVRQYANAFLQRRLLEEMNVQQLYPSFDALNVLGMCPWIINKPMLDVVIEVFQGEGWEDLGIPIPPSKFPPPPVFQPGMSKKERHQLRRERMAWNQKRAEMYSQWCDILYKLSIANHFRDRVFWLPHNFDFRGRAYPCPPHFSHIGSDVSRSILLFAVGKPLGKDGLRWLKLHLVNLTGLKKRASLEERLRFADEMMPEILDSADNPLTGNKWWAQADDPWQTLACCREVAAALRSPDPEAYVSHFPVHQDGSCNGLQHYAALGRDQEGAEQVNLHPYDTPRDVYSAVAEMVEEERAKDAVKGVEIARTLEGFVQRKVVKRPVMTVVYGVTRYGANLQVLKELEDMSDFPQDQCWRASRYLVDKIFLSLRRMFTATKNIQDWFTDCARVISKVCCQPVQWVTPLGLPVVQAYYSDRHKTPGFVTKHMKSMHVAPDANFDIFVRVNSMKQKNAFPPNFIHSLDSCHMMLTSLYCARQGITFVSVHDCFWTHPCTVDAMNVICREQFVALHSEPILKDLSAFLLHRFGVQESSDKVSNELSRVVHSTLAAVPRTGSFDLKNVLRSTYFFS